jgi:hypothetical protein
MYVKGKYEDVVSKPGLLGVMLKGGSELSYNFTASMARLIVTK